MSVRCDCLLVSADRLLLLMENADDGSLALPHVESERGWVADAVGSIQSQIRRQFGIDAVVLREIQRTPAGMVCEIEALSTALRKSATTIWRPASDPVIQALPPEQRQAVLLWREDRGVERRIAPWQRPGWFAEARRWIIDRVRRARLEITAEVGQVKGAWNGSCVLKVGTTGGPLYFKAAPSRRPGEPAALRALALRWSRNLPVVVDADDDRCWTLMREVLGEELDAGDIEALGRAARLVARIQIAEAADVECWSVRGCPDRGLDTMARRLPRLLKEIPARLCEAGVLTASERDEIGAFAAPAAAMCRALLASAIPGRSIHHEDFRAGNVRRSPNGELVILDWNDIVIAHPFFSIQRFLWFMDPPKGVDRHEILDGEADVLRRALRDAYLEPFTPFEPAPRLREAFRLSSLLAPVYDAFRFESSFDVDEVFRQGIGPEEAGIARALMDQILDIHRSIDSGASRL